MNATVSSRQLGKHLKAMRENAGLTVRAVAEDMAYSAAKISRQESGTHPVSPAELSHLVLRVYGGDEATLSKLEYYRQRSTQGKGWWTETGVNLPAHFEAYLGLEADAILVQSFALETVPGLLQTEGYARAQHKLSGQLTADEIDRYVRIRMRRQERLSETENPLQLDSVISEAALRRCGHHPDCDQLPHLLIRAQLPTVTLRVLPFTAGIIGLSSQCSLIMLPASTLPPVAHQETAIGGHIIEEESAIALMAHHMDTLRARALDPDTSYRFIEDLTKGS